MGTLRAMRSSPTAVAGRLEEELRFSLEAFRRRSNQSRYARSDAKESAKTATVAADVSSSDSLRVLCLHGYLQNGDVFKQKTGSLRRVLKGCEFTFLDAPHIAEPFPDSNPDMDDASSAGGVGGRGWWTSGENQQRKEGEAWVRPAQSFACAGFDEGVAHARSSCADIAQDGHGFDGVLAFSQGCAVASMLLREAQQDKGHPLANVKFAILVGGFIPRDTTIASRLRGENGIDSAVHEEGLGNGNFLTTSRTERYGTTNNGSRTDAVCARDASEYAREISKRRRLDRKKNERNWQETRRDRKRTNRFDGSFRNGRTL